MARNFNTDCTSRAQVRDYLQEAFIIDSDAALDAAIHAHGDEIERGIFLRSHTSYLGDQIAQAEGFDENPEFDPDDEYDDEDE